MYTAQINKILMNVILIRYSYDPFQQSPNENPEAELPVNAGDYLLVWGHMDEVMLICKII